MSNIEIIQMTWNLKAHNKRILLKWGLGFIVLFLFDVFMETLVLPLIDLDKSPKNDLHLHGWGFCVVLWLLFGYCFLNRRSKSRNS
mgnify:FL=1|jgi:hypothetical protein